MNSWDLMRAGNTELAIRELQKHYTSKGSTSSAMELGVAYLWLEDYHSAWRHFSGFALAYPRHVSDIYGMAGVARWCSGEPHEAIVQWRAGLECDFADEAGGVELPLLLLFAAVIRPDLATRSEVEHLLESHKCEPRIQNWPGPLVNYSLGRIDESGLRNACFHRDEVESAARGLMCDFYIGIAEHSRGKHEAYYEKLKQVSNVTWGDYDASPDMFLIKMWQEEFFLARYQVEAHDHL